MGSNESSASKKGTRQLARGRGEQTLESRLGPCRHRVPHPRRAGSGGLHPLPRALPGSPPSTEEGETRFQQSLP